MLENLRVLLGGEVAVLTAGRGVRGYDPVDELLQAPLALGCAERTAEVLRGDDVRRVDRPEVGELDSVLLEVDRTIPPVRHHHIATLPGDLVIGVDAFAGEDPAQGQALLAPALAVLRRGPAGRLGHVLSPSADPTDPIRASDRPSHLIRSPARLAGGRRLMPVPPDGAVAG